MINGNDCDWWRFNVSHQKDGGEGGVEDYKDDMWQVGVWSGVEIEVMRRPNFLHVITLLTSSPNQSGWWAHLVRQQQPRVCTWMTPLKPTLSLLQSCQKYTVMLEGCSNIGKGPQSLVQISQSLHWHTCLHQVCDYVCFGPDFPDDSHSIFGGRRMVILER